MGLDIYLFDGKTELDEKSDFFPEHLSSKTYLRSSYNSGGFDSVTENLYGVTLDDIFDAKKNGYLDGKDMDENGTMPLKNLDVALKKAEELVKKYNNEEAPLRVISIDMDEFATASEQDAIKITKKYMEEKDNEFFFGEFSNRNGTFFVGEEPLNNVRGIVNGKLFNSPAIHIVYEPEFKVHDSYRQMAMIVLEFIKYAMTLKEPRIIWSY